MTDNDADRYGSSTDRRTFLKAAGAGGIALGVAGCIGDSGGPDEVVLGQPASLTGQWDFLQPAVSQSTDLAVDEINDAGGPLGAEVNLQRRDTGVNPQEARSVVQQLINTDEAAAIVGLFSSEIGPLFDFLIEEEAPVVTPWPGSTALDERGGDGGTPEDLSDDQWIWRTIIGDTVHTLGAAQKLLDEGVDRFGLINGNTEGERSWANSVADAYENGGGNVVERVEVETGKSTYQSELERLFQADFDAFGVALGLDDATTMLRDWASAGYGSQPLLEDGLRSQDLIDAVGDEADGAWLAAGTGEGPGYDDFLPKFEDAGDADLHPWGVAAYDATNVVALAIEAAGEASHDAIQQHIGPVSRGPGTEVFTFEEGKEALDDGDDINYQGAATNCDFTEFGNVIGSVGIDRVTPDGFEREETIAAEDLTDLLDTY